MNKKINTVHIKEPDGEDTQPCRLDDGIYVSIWDNLQMLMIKEGNNPSEYISHGLAIDLGYESVEK